MIYQVSDDSYLLSKCVKKYAKGKSVLDIGTGTGIQALTAKQAGASSLLASDINPKSKNYLYKLNIPFIHSDLFNNIKGKFDLIIFNPPYLPKDKREPKDSQQATTGGKKGDEIILRFLKQASSHLSKNGIILLLLSSLTPQQRISKLLNQLCFCHNIIAQKKLFFETLQVWEITENQKIK